VTTEPDLLISFTSGDPATVDDLAGDLGDFLIEYTPAAQIQRLPEDPLSQVQGAALAIVLGRTVVTEFANGIAAWLARRQDARIVLRRITSGGELREVTLPGRPGTRAEQVATDFFTD